ncbi:MAG: phage integrase N-terminal SAM-like domain-containing protein, partial [Dehalococcoidia bacterium]|nr:phage integrase N-terminal SAM-like domain-containing protein [Dehalococcoidia bacterium]
MTTTVAGVDSPTVAALSVSFRRTLRSENKSPRTITAYLSAVEQFARFLEGAGMPLALASIRREHVEAFI